MLETVFVCCPYCGESFDTIVDVSAGSQDYIEDCYVCCRPIEFRVSVNNFQLEGLIAKTTDD